MTFNDQDITAIQTLGYTLDEARFLYLVAVHSGYFVPRQFLAFSGAKWGKRSNSFVAKLESRGHVTWREYDRTGGVYHLFSRTLYRYYYCVINNHRRLPQQNGQHGSCWSRALAILMRTVAMEFG
jgi:hypothetical protein